MRPKSKKNDPKSMSKNNTFLDSIFHRIFVVWVSENTSKIDYFFFHIFIQTSFLQKSWFSLREIANFEVLSLKNSTENRCKNAIESNVEKNDSKIEFWHRFWPPKTSKIAPKCDLKRSLFRDALRLAKKSSQGNGPRRL